MFKIKVNNLNVWDHPGERRCLSCDLKIAGLNLAQFAQKYFKKSTRIKVQQYKVVFMGNNCLALLSDSVTCPRARSRRMRFFG